MTPDFDDRHRKRTSQLRMIYDLTMGILWMAIGVFFLLHERLGYDLKLDKVLTTIFGVSAVLYGIFRIYRGIVAVRIR